MDELDPNVFRAPRTTESSPRKTVSKKPPRHQRGQRFLKGPIPWAWLQRALALPGKAVHVALFLWKEAGICKRRTVKLNLSALGEIGLSRAAARRGVEALGAAGLISVSRSPGHALKVTLQDVAPEDDTADEEESRCSPK